MSDRLHWHYSEATGLPVALYYGDKHLGDLKAMRGGALLQFVGQLHAFDGLTRWRYELWPDPPLTAQAQQQ